MPLSIICLVTSWKKSQIQSTEASSLILFIIWEDIMVNKLYLRINICSHPHHNNAMIFLIPKASKYIWFLLIKTTSLVTVTPDFCMVTTIFLDPTPNNMWGQNGLMNFIIIIISCEILYIHYIPPWYDEVGVCDILKQDTPHVHVNRLFQMLIWVGPHRGLSGCY